MRVGPIADPSPRAIGVAIAVGVLIISVALAAPRDRRRSPPPSLYPGSHAVRPLPSILPSAPLGARVRVAIVRDAAAASYFTDAAELDTIIGHWRRAIRRAGADPFVVRSADVRGLRTAQVLVIPSSPCLTLQTRVAIDAAGARGQGLILSGLVGTHDAGCRSIGYGLLASMTGASRVERLEARPMVYVTIPDGTPLSLSVPPGARLDVRPAEPVALRHRARAAYYSDYQLVPQPAGEHALLDGALLATSAGRTRVVYWGFELRDVAPAPWSQALAGLLVRNSVAWAARLPMGAVEPWPDGRRAAAVLAQDVEDRFENARHALDSLRAVGVRSTFFLTSNLAVRHRRLARDIAKLDEVGTHSENHVPLPGTPVETQRERLELSRRELTRLVERPVLGLRPPREEFDRATMSAWLAAGGRYLFGANDSRVAAPELLELDGDTLVLFGRVTHDDFAAVGPRGARDPNELAGVLLGEFGKTRALGGLYLLSYHSQLMARPDMVPALARLAREIAADSTVWLTTAGDVASWWRERARLQVTIRKLSPEVLSISVRHRGPDALGGIVIRAMLDGGRRAVSADAPLLPSEAGVVRLAVPVLSAGERREFRIVLAPST